MVLQKRPAISLNLGHHRESSIFRIIKWVENTLIKDGSFALPGRKALLKSDMEYEVVLVDATGSPIERSKKSKDTATVARKSVTP